MARSLTLSPKAPTRHTHLLSRASVLHGSIPAAETSALHPNRVRADPNLVRSPRGDRHGRSAGRLLTWLGGGRGGQACRASQTGAKRLESDRRLGVERLARIRAEAK
ncbi:hypothetical protein GY45DRAFT_1325223 [Cubamyces sp. BRFM 1775]|nr:hypothetical protein GY45DRAFT_1325223 [Cubamyces sp. BRFM 1775]